MQQDQIQIANLLYRYNEFIDLGDLKGATDLFAHAKIKLVSSAELQDHHAVLQMLQGLIRIYPDGTPRTKHLVTNPIIEISADGQSATSRSQYTVMQSTDEIPLQIIAVGRYHDKFEKVDSSWRFTYRDYTLSDMKGRVEGHLMLKRP